MSKYHFYFEDRLGRRIVEYDTDIEPPVVGDFVRLNKMTNDQDRNLYVVYERWYMPVDEHHVDVTLSLDIGEEGLFD